MFERFKALFGVGSKAEPASQKEEEEELLPPPNEQEVWGEVRSKLADRKPLAGKSGFAALWSWFLEFSRGHEPHLVRQVSAYISKELDHTHDPKERALPLRWFETYQKRYSLLDLLKHPAHPIFWSRSMAIITFRARDHVWLWRHRPDAFRGMVWSLELFWSHRKRTPEDFFELLADVCPVWLKVNENYATRDEFVRILNTLDSSRLHELHWPFVSPRYMKKDAHGEWLMARGGGREPFDFAFDAMMESIFDDEDGLEDPLPPAELPALAPALFNEDTPLRIVRVKNLDVWTFESLVRQPWFAHVEVLYVSTIACQRAPLDGPCALERVLSFDWSETMLGFIRVEDYRVSQDIARLLAHMPDYFARSNLPALIIHGSSEFDEAQHNPCVTILDHPRSSSSHNTFPSWEADARANDAFRIDEENAWGEDEEE